MGCANVKSPGSGDAAAGKRAGGAPPKRTASALLGIDLKPRTDSLPFSPGPVGSRKQIKATALPDNVVAAMSTSEGSREANNKTAKPRRTVYFPFQKSTVAMNRILGLAAELEENGWGTAEVTTRSRSRAVAEKLIAQCDIFITFLDDETSISIDEALTLPITSDDKESLEANGTIMLNDEIASATTRRIIGKGRAPQVIFLSTALSSAAATTTSEESRTLVYYSAGIERAKMWHLIFDESQASSVGTNGAVEPSTQSNTVKTLPRPPSLDHFAYYRSPSRKQQQQEHHVQPWSPTTSSSSSSTSLSAPAVYLLAPSTLSNEIQKLPSMFALRKGIHCRVLTELDDLTTLIGENPQARLIVFYSSFKEDQDHLLSTLSLRALRIATKRKHKQNRGKLLLVRMVGLGGKDGEEEISSSAFHERLTNQAKQRGINAELPQVLNFSLTMNQNNDSMRGFVLTEWICELVGLTALPFRLPTSFVTESAVLQFYRMELRKDVLHGEGSMAPALESAITSSSRGTKLVVCQSPSGGGKSVLLSHFCVERNVHLAALAESSSTFASSGRSTVSAFHFFQARNGAHSTLRHCMKSLHMQLCARFALDPYQFSMSEEVNFPSRVDLYSMFHELVVEPCLIAQELNRDLSGERIVIVLDAVDECDQSAELWRILKRFAHNAELQGLVTFVASTSRYVSEPRDHNEEDTCIKVILDSSLDIEQRINKCLNRRGFDDVKVVSGDLNAAKLASFFIFIEMFPMATCTTDSLHAKLSNGIDSLYAEFVSNWQGTESDVKFALAVRTALLIPREPIPERVWVDLQLSSTIPEYCHQPSSRVIRCPHCSLYEYLRSRYPEAEDLEAHRLVASILDKPKWLVPAAVETLTKPVTASPSPVLFYSGINNNETRKDSSDDSDAESQPGRSRDESVLDVAADVRRSYLGSISAANEFGIDHLPASPPSLSSALDTNARSLSDEGNIRKYRLVRRPTPNIDHSSTRSPTAPSASAAASPSAAAASPSLSVKPAMSSSMSRVPHAANALLMIDLEELGKRLIVSQSDWEEKFTTEQFAYHWFKVFELLGNDNEDKETQRKHAMRMYKTSFLDVEKLTVRCRKALEFDTFDEFLLQDAIAYRPYENEYWRIVPDLLLFAKKALMVDVHQLYGQILGRIPLHLVSKNPYAEILTKNCEKRISGLVKTGTFSAIAMPNRHFSGLTRVGQQLEREFLFSFPVYCLALLPQGTSTTSSWSLVAIAGWDGYIRIIDLTSGALVYSIEVDFARFPILSLAYSPTGKGNGMLVCGLSNGKVKIFSATSPFQETDLMGDLALNKRSKVNCIAVVSSSFIDPAASSVYCGLDDGRLLELSLKEMKLMNEYRVVTNDSITCMQVTTELAIMGTTSRIVLVRETSKIGSEVDTVATLKGHSGEIKCLLLSQEYNLLFTGSSDKTCRIWDCQTWTCLRVLSSSVHFSSVTSVAFHYPYLVTASDMVRIIHLEEGEVVRTLKCSGHQVNMVIILPAPTAATTNDEFKGESVLSMCTTSDDHSVRYWKVSVGSLERTLRRRQQRLADVVKNDADDEDSATIFDEDEDDDNDEQSETEGFDLHSLVVTNVSIDQKGEFALTSSLDCTARLWKLDTGKTCRVLRGHTDVVYCCSLSRDALLCATGSLDRTCRVWNAKTAETLQVLRHPDVVFSVFISSPENSINEFERLVVTGSYDGARVFECDSGEQLEDSYVKQNLFDIPIVAATDLMAVGSSNNSQSQSHFTVVGVDTKNSVGFTPDQSGDDLRKCYGRFVFGPVSNSFAVWNLWT